MTASPSEALKNAKFLNVRVVENGFIVADQYGHPCEEKTLWVFPNPYELREWMMQWGDVHHPLELVDDDDPSAENSDGCAKWPDSPVPTQPSDSPCSAIHVFAGASSVPWHFDNCTDSQTAFALLLDLKLGESSFGYTARYFRGGRLDGIFESWRLLTFRDLVSFVVKVFPNSLTAVQILSLI